MYIKFGNLIKEIAYSINKHFTSFQWRTAHKMNRPFSWQEREWVGLIRHLMTILSERLGTIFRLLIRFYRRRKEPFKNSCQQRTPFIYYFPFIFSSFKVIDSLSFLPALKSMPQAAVSRNAKIPIRIAYGTDTGWSLSFRMNLSKLKMHSTISKMSPAGGRPKIMVDHLGQYL